jgi:hypothetical protein
MGKPNEKFLTMKMRVYDNNGRERWMAAGQIVPKGWMVEESQSFKVLDKDFKVIMMVEEGNPYDQISKNQYSLKIQPI